MEPGGRLTHAVEATLRGVQEAVYVPMFLTDLSRCEACVMKIPCFNPGGLDALESLAPGLAGRAQAVGESVRAVAASLSPGERRQLLGMLRRLAGELAARDGLTSDLQGAVAVLGRVLEPIGA
jgi:hypothetical protein